jgi:SAM-dependent methyltransferase
VYGKDPEHYFRELLAHTSLRPEQLASKKVLEIGFGHGRLLRQIQEWSPSAYGLDLAKPLRSAQLRPGSAIFGNLLSIPFVPGQFDLVICRGVVHHTPDPEASFGCVAEQVADHGMLYFAGCYEPGKHKMLMLRRVLPRSWDYPEPLLLGLASVFGGLRSILEGIRSRKADLGTLRRHYRHYKLEVFDVMAPRWSGVLGAETVVPWFTSRGLQVRKVDDGSYVGIKADAPSEAQDRSARSTPLET